ncbi:MAG: 3-deoxy-manno-octulosonate cytidylyltransferase [Acidobacteria bacterium]|nr:3-deoxy-manno-octulosonate cytidylyltransferase [Acidobacteriota bacterium]
MPSADAVVGAIPARYGSTRLPGKALAVIAGKPMIEHVYRRAQEVEGLDRVVVLTDDERILGAVETFGGLAQMTPADCASGTDRIAWAAKDWQAAAVVNIQGDEPLVDPVGVGRLARHLRRFPDDPMVTLAAPAREEELSEPAAVKVVLDCRGYALYFSRAAIPYPRTPGVARPLKHIGIYGYQRRTLLHLAGLQPTPLERAEGLEQLRALENGVPIRVLEVERSSPGVDTPEDLERVRRMVEGAV